MADMSGAVIRNTPSCAWTIGILARSAKFYLRCRGLSKHAVAELFRPELAVWYAVFIRKIPVSVVAATLHMGIASVRITAYNAERVLKAHGIESRVIE